jgi:hypothetical protein
MTRIDSLLLNGSPPATLIVQVIMITGSMVSTSALQLGSLNGVDYDSGWDTSHLVSVTTVSGDGRLVP